MRKRRRPRLGTSPMNVTARTVKPRERLKGAWSQKRPNGSWMPCRVTSWMLNADVFD